MPVGVGGKLRSFQAFEQENSTHTGKRLFAVRGQLLLHRAQHNQVVGQSRNCAMFRKTTSSGTVSTDGSSTDKERFRTSNRKLYPNN